MTTDITELAQSLKAAAEKATPGQWGRGDGKNGGELLVYCDDALGPAVCEATGEYNAIPKYQRIDNLDFIAMANPANVLALVEALEKAQAINAAAEKLVRCKGRYHSEQNYRALAALFGVNTPDLPPLDGEPRAVTVENLQESAYRAGLTAGWNLGLANNNDGFNKCLAAHTAGIKWEAE